MGGPEDRKKDIPVGQNLSGKASDQLRDYVNRTGDDSTWLGPNGETQRGGRDDRLTR